MSDLRAPGWVRAAQIGLGVLAIIISITLLVIPGAVLTTIIFIIGILLLIVGIESVISGLFVKSKSRMASIGLGILVIILSLIVIAFPSAVGVFVLILIGIVHPYRWYLKTCAWIWRQRAPGLVKRIPYWCGSIGNCPRHLDNGFTWIWSCIRRPHNRNSRTDSRNRNGYSWD